MSAASGDRFRLAEVIAALSLATDIADGHPWEKALRTCWIAIGTARQMDLEEESAADVYYTALLRFIGCTSFAHEEARALGGDDIAVRRIYGPVDFARPTDVLSATFRQLAKGAGAKRRIRAVTTFLFSSSELAKEMASSHCDVAVRLATRLGMSTGVTSALAHMYERWDGKGFLEKVEAEGIALAARIVQLAHVTEICHRAGGQAAAREVVRSRAGGQFDPLVARAFLSCSEEIFAVIESGSVWEPVLLAEPAEPVRVPASRLDEVARAFGDFVDLKVTFGRSHSSGVARVSEAAGRLMKMSEDDLALLRRAARLHDLGRVSVPNSIWEKQGRLGAAEWERIRLHPYYTERVLCRSPVLAPLAAIAGMHHERMDGSGYHRSAPAAVLSTTARILASADAYHAMTEERSYRPALSRDQASAAMREEVSRGRLDPEAVAAVLEAEGHGRHKRDSKWPADLTDREVEVLRAVAKGRTNKEVGALLKISPRTVQHHLLHIYQKVGVSSRAGATLFAMEHDLLRRF